MVFVRIPFSFASASQILVVEATRIEDIAEEVQSRRGLPISFLSLYRNGRRVGPDQDVAADAFVDVVLSLPGGKGGFGSMLRALGAQIEKTTNKEACRDLSGRRLRDINEEDRLKKYVAKKADREREAEEKKKAKLEKLRRMAKEENKHEFNDPKYSKEREEVTERVHAAMEHALNSVKEGPKPSTSGTKRKSEDTKAGPSSAAKKGLWIGVDLRDSDLESSSDEEETCTDTLKKKTVNGSA